MSLSQRDRLLAYLRQSGLSTARAEANLDAYAHELAEQIRRSEVVDIGYPARSEYAMGLHAGADLIDPSAGPVRPDEEPTT